MNTLLLSLLIDTVVGDPPNEWHPTAWMGTLIGKLKRLAPPERGRFAYGGLITLGGMALVWTIGRMLVHLSDQLPKPIALVCQAAILKTTISLSGLNKAASAVKAELDGQDLSEARRLLSWHLVSRDTSELTPAQVSAAAIESVAENFSDGVIAPLTFYALGGIPAALAYRYLNTCDSMLGYRDPEHEWFGKIPARLDDVANWVPARITAASILAVAPLNLAWEPALETWRSDASTTDSPNAGQPMSAMAGTLQVKLDKVGQYKLGRFFREPNANDIGRSLGVMRIAMGMCVALFWLLIPERK